MAAGGRPASTAAKAVGMVAGMVIDSFPASLCAAPGAISSHRWTASD